MMNARFARKVLVPVAVLTVVLLVSPAAYCADYGLGYTWNRQADWTVRPGSDHGTTNGNPDDDSLGSPVWGYEYYDNVPDGSDLDSANPWYTLSSAGLMVWDNNWYDGGARMWAQADDTLPSVGEAVLIVASETWPDVVLVRWTTPSNERIRVSLTSGTEFGVRWSGYGGITSPVDLDVVIAKLDASDGNSITSLWSTTVSKPTNNSSPETLSLPALSLPDVTIDPGDQILFSIRAREWVSGPRDQYFYDDISITIVPEPATLSLLGLGALALIRRRKR